MAEQETIRCPHCHRALAVVSGLDAAKLRAVEKAAAMFDVSPETVMGRSRRRRAVQARHHTFKLLREDGYTYPEIGEAMGVDHSTVQHALKKAGAPRVCG